MATDMVKARAMLKNYKIKPNKTEERLIDLLELYIPGKFAYNGGEVIIEGMVPDFVSITNDSKCFLEVVGRRDIPKHSPEALQHKVDTYGKYGFSVMFIYQKDFKDEEELAKNIVYFRHFGIGKDNVED